MVVHPSCRPVKKKKKKKETQTENFNLAHFKFKENLVPAMFLEQQRDVCLHSCATYAKGRRVVPSTHSPRHAGNVGVALREEAMPW